MITKDIPIEDLIEAYPDAVGFLVEEGLPCVVCGEPFWGTLRELAEQKGLGEQQLQALVTRFNLRHRQ